MIITARNFLFLFFFSSKLIGIANIHVFFYSFEAVIVDSLEAKGAVSRCLGLLA